jgi:predicted nucleotidyltransferase
MPTPTFDFPFILRSLAASGVKFIVVGGVCGVLHGAPITTFDLDLVHSRSPENLERLLKVLEDLDAIYREQPQRRLHPGLSHLASAGHQLLLTRAGPLDLLGTVREGCGYDELLPHTVELLVADDLTVRLLNLATLIALKEEAGRDKDKAVLPILRRTKEEKEKQ